MFICINIPLVHMEHVDDQDVQVRRDLANLSRALTRENINTDLMFARTRGIRSCTPQFGTTSKSSISVSEQLKRARLPAE
jgi:hypothetical protein